MIRKGRPVDVLDAEQLANADDTELESDDYDDSSDSPLERSGFEPVWGFSCQVVF